MEVEVEADADADADSDADADAETVSLESAAETASVARNNAAAEVTAKVSTCRVDHMISDSIVTYCCCNRMSDNKEQS